MTDLLALCNGAEALGFPRGARRLCKVLVFQTLQLEAPELSYRVPGVRCGVEGSGRRPRDRYTRLGTEKPALGHRGLAASGARAGTHNSKAHFIGEMY